MVQSPSLAKLSTRWPVFISLSTDVRHMLETQNNFITSNSSISSFPCNSRKREPSIAMPKSWCRFVRYLYNKLFILQSFLCRYSAVTNKYHLFFWRMGCTRSWYLLQVKDNLEVLLPVNFKYYLFNHLSCLAVQIRKFRIFWLHLLRVYFGIRRY